MHPFDQTLVNRSTQADQINSTTTLENHKIEQKPTKNCKKRRTNLQAIASTYIIIVLFWEPVQVLLFYLLASMRSYRLQTKAKQI